MNFAASLAEDNRRRGKRREEVSGGGDVWTSSSSVMAGGHRVPSQLTWGSSSLNPAVRVPLTGGLTAPSGGQRHCLALLPFNS